MVVHLRTPRRFAAAFVIIGALACASIPPVPQTPSAATAAVSTATSLAAAPDRYVTSADARLRYRDIGRGDAVVLLHGMARSLEDWRGLADTLALDHRVIAVDVRGHGKSTRFSDPARLGIEMAHDVVRVMDQLGIRRAHIAGHSMGATIAAKVASLYPDRVSSVALIAGPFSPDTTSFTKDERGFAADVEQGRGMMGLLRWLFPTYPDSVLRAFDTEAMATNDAATIGAAMRGMDRLMTVPGALGTRRVPAAVIIGAGDPLLASSRWLASWWPGARLVEIPDADHLTVIFDARTRAEMRTLFRSTP